MAITVRYGSPIKITGTTNTNDLVLSDQVYVKFVYWYAPTTAGHLCAIKNSKGEEIAMLRCDDDNRSEILPVCQLCNGIYCDDLDSGEVYIYIR